MSDQMSNPYVNGTIEEVAAAERTSYFIIVGERVFAYHSQMAFSKDDAHFHFQKLKEFYLEVIQSGNTIEKTEAVKNLLTLKVMPLRIN
jgi:hypothetical protein